MSFYIRFGSLPGQATDTVNFINRVDQLFDILNSSQALTPKKYNAAFKASSFQFEFLLKCLAYFKRLEIKDKNNVDITTKVKFINSLLISINSVINLYYYLRDNAGFQYILTRRLNQDCLENHFGKITNDNGNCINPTPIQFHRTFRKFQ